MVRTILTLVLTAAVPHFAFAQQSPPQSMWFKPNSAQPAYAPPQNKSPSPNNAASAPPLISSAPAGNVTVRIATVACQDTWDLDRIRSAGYRPKHECIAVDAGSSFPLVKDALAQPSILIGSTIYFIEKYTLAPMADIDPCAGISPEAIVAAFNRQRMRWGPAGVPVTAINFSQLREHYVGCGRACGPCTGFLTIADPQGRTLTQQTNVVRRPGSASDFDFATVQDLR